MYMSRRIACLSSSDEEHAADPASGFKTDTDISKSSNRRERELQAWQPSEDASAPSAPGGASGPASNGGPRDDLTFGAGASNGGAWNQFEVNERLFGVKANFDEDLYTTKLDRNAPDFKDRERWAANIANEILQSQTGNVHVAEERKQDFVGEGKDEEEKCACCVFVSSGCRSDVETLNRYGAVVRGANAYVPPGARKSGQGPTPPAGGKQDVPKVSVNAPDGTAVSGDKEKEKADAARTTAAAGTSKVL